MFRISFIYAVLFWFLVSNSFAQIKLPAIIGSNMVLQQQQVLPVWGRANPGSTVKISFAGQSKTALVNKDSIWSVQLDALKANKSPQVMTITCDTSKIELKNILVGEVWLCSGQSNMEYGMNKDKNKYKGPKRGADSAAIAMQTTHPGIRIFNVQKKLSLPDVTSTGWNECEGTDFGMASAAGFFFGKHIQEELDVPVGIISSSWGGTRIELWTPSSAYLDIPAFSEEIKNKVVIDGVEPGKYYRSMIAPLAPFAIKGVLWYQGESNCMIEEHDMRYASKTQALVESWRKQWNKADLPFYYVLLTPFAYTRRKDPKRHTVETLPAFWEQQVAAAKIPNTGFVTTTDLVDELKNIHPSYKWEIGKRLGALALAKTYHKTGIIYSGPQFLKMKKKREKIILEFRNAEGLKTRDGKAPDFFSIAAKDGKFVVANAEIKGNTVILSSEQVKKPANVRFAWTEAAMPNLVNIKDLPAVPFRTDAEVWKYRVR